VDNKCLQEERNFKNLCCEISYGNVKYVQQELTKFAQILGILNNNFQPNLVQKLSRIRVYNALALHILLHEREIWALR
jgi:hypothetical protein